MDTIAIEIALEWAMLIALSLSPLWIPIVLFVYAILSKPQPAGSFLFASFIVLECLAFAAIFTMQQLLGH